MKFINLLTKSRKKTNKNWKKFNKSLKELQKEKE